MRQMHPITCGATWLGIVMGLDVQQTLMAGVVPFLLGDVLKIIAATAVVKLSLRGTA